MRPAPRWCRPPSIMSEPRASLVTAEPVERAQRVLVVGCGGIGGITAACLTETWSALGVEVVGYTTNTEIAEAIRRHGYRLTGVDGARGAGPCVTELAPTSRPSTSSCWRCSRRRWRRPRARRSRGSSPTGPWCASRTASAKTASRSIAGPDRARRRGRVGRHDARARASTSAPPRGGFAIGRIDGATTRGCRAPRGAAGVRRARDPQRPTSPAPAGASSPSTAPSPRSAPSAATGSGR
jgi:hypothetical protein